MKRFLILAVTLCASIAAAQTPELSALDKAYEEARAAQLALQAVEAKREQAAEPQGGERSGTASGFSRLNDNYYARQATLEQEVAAARKRYESALKRWNDLK